MIAAAGPTSVSDEFTEPDTPSEINRWKKYGYNFNEYVNAWQQTFGVYKTDFKEQYVSLSHGNGITRPAETQNDLVHGGSSALHDRFVFQSSALSGDPSHHSSAIQMVISDNGKFGTGFQLGSACETAPAKMGAAGDPPLALVRSIDNGMQLHKGVHADFIEVHDVDVEADEMQPVLKWAAALFPIESALNVIMTSQAVEGAPGLSPINVTVTFSEPVKNFTAADLKVSDGVVSGLTKSDDNSYTFILGASAPTSMPRSIFRPIRWKTSTAIATPRHRVPILLRTKGDRVAADDLIPWKPHRAVCFAGRKQDASRVLQQQESGNPRLEIG